MVTFFAWTDFCDDLISKAHESISESVAAEIRQHFFTKTFEKELCIASSITQEDTNGHSETSQEDKEIEALNGHTVSIKLALLGQIWLHIKSDGFAREFSKWLLGD